MNALAILIFMAQLDNFVGDGLLVYAMVAIGLAIIYLLPRVTKVVPAPLIAIAAIGAAAALFKLTVPTVGDMGSLPSALPGLGLPHVPFSLSTLRIIAPVAFTLALVGLLESLLTAHLMDDITDENSDKDRESKGQGAANIVTGFLGGMAGCAMIGQSMINLRSGARTRLSTLSAGIFLLLMILVAGPIVGAIPMAALVAVMIVVAVGTFDWSSIRPATIRRSPRSETAVMVVTIAIVVLTHNLAIGVVAGVLLSAIFFARRVAHLVEVTDVEDPDGGIRIYAVTGEFLCVYKRTRSCLRLPRRNAESHHRSNRRPHLGQLGRSLARHDRCQVRAPRHHCRDRRAQHRQCSLAPAVVGAFHVAPLNRRCGLDDIVL